MSFAVVGLTGGIGSGKSTVASLFAALGVPIVDADQLARDVVAPGTDGLREIVDAFGAAVLDPTGALDRKKVGELVFADEQARRRLETITHPRIAQASLARFGELAAQGHAYAIYEAALLVESGRHRMFPALIVVSASEATQLARVCARDGVDEAAARSRIAAQMPLARKLEVADYVIDNDGDLGATREQTERVHRALRTRFTGDAA